MTSDRQNYLVNFFQFILNFLWMTQTQEIITCRVLKIHKLTWGDVYDWEKVS